MIHPMLVHRDDRDSMKFYSIDFVTDEDANEILARLGATLIRVLNEMSIESLCDWLSLRPLNICRTNGIKTIRQFMELRSADFLRLRHAGQKSWNEVDKVQRQIRGEIAWE